MSQTERDSDGGTSTETETISTHDEAGYGPRDVLTDAEEGDDIFLEMEFYDHPFESIRGTVANIIESETAYGELSKKTVQVDTSGEIEMVNLSVLYSAGCVFIRDEIRFVKRDEDDYVFVELDCLNHCELEREVEA